MQHYIFLFRFFFILMCEFSVSSCPKAGLVKSKLLFTVFLGSKGMAKWYGNSYLLEVGLEH